jgi:hypothetical protein
MAVRLWVGVTVGVVGLVLLIAGGKGAAPNLFATLFGNVGTPTGTAAKPNAQQPPAKNVPGGVGILPAIAGNGGPGTLPGLPNILGRIS